MANHRILIVEDEPDIREVMKMLLEMLGYEVSMAENGQEGLKSLSEMEEPCLILLDLMMPVMDGWAFAEALSQNEKFSKIPIVVVTAFAEDAHTVKNARAVIRKPADLSHLQSVVRKFCVS